MYVRTCPRQVLCTDGATYMSPYVDEFCTQNQIALPLWSSTGDWDMPWVLGVATKELLNQCGLPTLSFVLICKGPNHFQPAWLSPQFRFPWVHVVVCPLLTWVCSTIQPHFSARILKSQFMLHFSSFFPDSTRLITFLGHMQSLAPLHGLSFRLPVWRSESWSSATFKGGRCGDVPPK